jgi:hypothetical protein
MPEAFSSAICVPRIQVCCDDREDVGRRGKQESMNVVVSERL